MRAEENKGKEKKAHSDGEASHASAEGLAEALVLLRTDKAIDTDAKSATSTDTRREGRTEKERGESDKRGRCRFPGLERRGWVNVGGN